MYPNLKKNYYGLKFFIWVWVRIGQCVAGFLFLLKFNLIWVWIRVGDSFTQILYLNDIAVFEYDHWRAPYQIKLLLKLSKSSWVIIPSLLWNWKQLSVWFCFWIRFGVKCDYCDVIYARWICLAISQSCLPRSTFLFFLSSL